MAIMRLMEYQILRPDEIYYDSKFRLGLQLKRHQGIIGTQSYW